MVFKKIHTSNNEQQLSAYLVVSLLNLATAAKRSMGSEYCLSHHSSQELGRTHLWDSATATIGLLRPPPFALFAFPILPDMMLDHRIDDHMHSLYVVPTAGPGH